MTLYNIKENLKRIFNILLTVITNEIIMIEGLEILTFFKKNLNFCDSKYIYIIHVNEYIKKKTLLVSIFTTSHEEIHILFDTFV